MSVTEKQELLKGKKKKIPFQFFTEVPPGILLFCWLGQGLKALIFSRSFVFACGFFLEAEQKKGSKRLRVFTLRDVVVPVAKKTEKKKEN
jgi:hypothetical protein